MTKGLAIADGFALPLEYVTSTGGILAKKGAGKSNAAVVMAEAMYAAGVPWVAVDPKGDWYGIRSSGDGKGPGLPVIVFGGRHGDVPLEPTAGALIADLVLDQRLTCVLDVSEFSKADVRRFLLAFADRLYRQADAEPLHLFLEEAHEYLPQMVRGDDAALVGAWQRIVKQGRFKGLGVTIISQRSAAVNKDVLTQVDTLIVMRTTSPQDRKAVDAWIDVHADSDEALKTLPSLAAGEAWIWAPEWNLLQRITFRRRATFDSGATPKIGEARRAPATLADVDLGAIKEQMAATIEKAKADDPKELRKQIAQLQRERAELEAAVAEMKPATEIVRVEVPVFDRELLDAVEERLKDIYANVGRAVQDTFKPWHDEQYRVRQMLEAIDDRKDAPRARPASRRPDPVERPRPTQRPDPHPRRTGGTTVPLPTPPAAASDLSLGIGERKILAAVAQHGSVSREQLTVLLGYKRSSRNTYIQRLKAADLVFDDGNRLAATDAGIAELGDDYEPLPTGADLRSFWLDKLSGGEREILRLLIDAHPASLDRETIGDELGYKRSSRNTYLQRLRARELVTVEGGAVAASAILFE